MPASTLVIQPPCAACEFISYAAFSWSKQQRAKQRAQPKHVILNKFDFSKPGGFDTPVRMRHAFDKDVSPDYVAQRLLQQYGDQALKALHAMTFSKERRGAAQRKALFKEVADILVAMQGPEKRGGVVDISA